MVPSLQSLAYLAGVYWPYLAGAAAIGVLAGWWAGAPSGRRG